MFLAISGRWRSLLVLGLVLLLPAAAVVCSLVDVALIYFFSRLGNSACRLFFFVLCLFQTMMPQEPTLNFSGVDLCILNQETHLHAVLEVLFFPPHM